MPLVFFGAFGKTTEARTNNSIERAGLSLKNAQITAEEIDPLGRIGKGITTINKEKMISRENGEIDSAEAPFAEEEKDNALNYEMLVGYPIEQMIPSIRKQDENIAGLLVAIAKKESDWGKYSPSIAGQDCFNYWGLKGRGRTVGSGYRCFNSPDEAVQAVSDKIGAFVAKGMDTPAKLVVWKCGSSCASHDPKDVQRWVGDINKYLQLIKS